ncbi:asparagine synthase-related protein [Paenibacillus solisilvae]|uniref:asparagine synthase (glutamine-hydrolyzing) n=1 Tax=Paenibacillus solisilvae TaxID=2486751 RepID=A0ABW0W6G7_9BACL
MSAILGVLQHDNPELIHPEMIEHMMGALKQYPADDVRIWHSRGISLGCHAQWITPESVQEMLPYYDEEHRLSITADAIIDNREELFNRLQVEHARRHNMPDSQLIILAYLKWGKDAPCYLIGDYAFVIWDEAKRQLFGARDLLGNRSLYFHHQQGQFAFCTVVNPLFSLPGVKKELNESWFSEFLAIPVVLDAIDVYSTVYRNIEQLPPAQRFTLVSGKLRVEQYGSLVTPIEKLKLRTDGEYEEAFRAVFQEAVNSKLRTFKQVGASLSGGLDSAAVVSFAADPLRSEGKTLHTYSYVPSPDFVDWTGKSMVADERPYMNSIVQHVGNMSDRYLDFPNRNSLEEVDDLLHLMEGPYKFFENSFWIKGILEQAEQHGVGVLLNGARGNYSISWGPAADYYARLMRRFRWVHLNRELKLYGRHFGVGRKRLLPYIAKQAFPFARQFPFFRKQAEVPPLLIHPDFAGRTKVIERLQSHDVGLREYMMDEFESRVRQFGDLSVSNHQGTSTTRFSLRYGVWERDPTSDPRVIRFCLSVPIEQYVQNGVDRALIRRSTERYLPDSVRLNQRIRGVQGADWIHRMLPSWRSFTEEVEMFCRDSAASEYLNVKQIKQSLAVIGHSPKPEAAFDPDARLLMQSLIVFRFLKQFSS